MKPNRPFGLPDRRATVTYRVAWLAAGSNGEPHLLDLSIGRARKDGPVLEIFIGGGGKEGATLRSNLEHDSIMASHLLQMGYTLEGLADMLGVGEAGARRIEGMYGIDGRGVEVRASSGILAGVVAALFIENGGYPGSGPEQAPDQGPGQAGDGA